MNGLLANTTQRVQGSGAYQVQAGTLQQRLFYPHKLCNAHSTRYIIACYNEILLGDAQRLACQGRIRNLLHLHIANDDGFSKAQTRS